MLCHVPHWIEKLKEKDTDKVSDSAFKHAISILNWRDSLSVLCYLPNDRGNENVSRDRLYKKYMDNLLGLALRYLQLSSSISG